MGNAAAHLQIRLDSPASSQTLAGVIFLKVEKEQFDCDQLRLQIRGSETSKVVYTTTSNKKTTSHTAHEKHEFLQTDCVVTIFQGAARRGEYEFPFQVNLPLGLPGSIENEHYKISYCMQARLHREGWTKWDVMSSEYPIHQAGMQQSTDGMQFPEMLIPRADPVFYFCCIGAGTMFTAGAVSNTRIAPYSPVKCTFAFDNQSSTDAREMVVRIVETVNLQASGHRACFRRYIGGEQRVRLPAGRNPAAKSPPAAFDEGTIRRLADALARPDALSATFQLPPGMKPSHTGQLVQVRAPFHERLFPSFM
jgi:hypothetical protein